MVEDGVYASNFVCHINRCKGICCIEGDFGALLEEEEVDILLDIQEAIKPYLEPESIPFLDENGPTTYYEENKSIGTPVHADGRCAYAVYNQDGSIGCGIEHAYFDGQIDFRKPISCHLYPIRIKKHPENGMELMTYEKWHICAPACSHGDKLGVRLYQFTREAIERKYGQEFFDQLSDAVDNLH